MLNDGSITTFDEFCDLVRLVFRNCFCYNPYTNPVFKLCRALAETFETEVYKLRHPDLAAKKIFPFSKGGAALTSRDAIMPPVVSRKVPTKAPAIKTSTRTPKNAIMKKEKGPFLPPVVHSFTPAADLKRVIFSYFNSHLEFAGDEEDAILSKKPAKSAKSARCGIFVALFEYSRAVSGKSDDSEDAALNLIPLTFTEKSNLQKSIMSLSYDKMMELVAIVQARSSSKVVSIF